MRLDCCGLVLRFIATSARCFCYERLRGVSKRFLACCVAFKGWYIRSNGEFAKPRQVASVLRPLA